MIRPRKTHRKSSPPKLTRNLKKALERTVLSLVNGVSYVVDGAAKPTMGNAAKELVWKRGKLELWRIKPLAVEEVEIGTHELEVEMVPPHPVPILLIPP